MSLVIGKLELYDRIKCGFVKYWPGKTCPEIVRFWYKVDKNGPIHPIHGQCWVWKGGGKPGGYGMFLKTSSHRYSYKIHYEDPKNLDVLHKCDNPRCVNPDHLFLGTQKDNMIDMKNKQRNHRGQDRDGAILTDIEVREIKSTYIYGSRLRGTTALARKYKVSPATIYDIVSGKKWTHI